MLSALRKFLQSFLHVNNLLIQKMQSSICYGNRTRRREQHLHPSQEPRARTRLRGFHVLVAQLVVGPRRLLLRLLHRRPRLHECGSDDERLGAAVDKFYGA